MLEEIIVKYNRVILFTIGTLLIILALFLGLYSRIELTKERVFSEIEYLMEENDDDGNIDLDNENILESEISINTDYLEDENLNVENPNDSENNEQPNNTIKKDYIGYLIIPKISLNYGLVAIDSPYNHVDKNIEILKVSDFPDVLNGNFIIAGHSGNSQISYFKYLYRLNIGDLAKVKYNDKTYTYKIKDIYKEERDGTIVIKRDINKNTLTLITCSYKDKKHQTIYIAELDNVV